MQQTGTLAVAPVPPVPERLLSADEFMALPLNLKLYELVRGVLVRMPMTGYEHGEIESNIIRLLDRHIWPRRLGQITPGDVMFRLEQNPDTLRQPDVAFVRADRLPPLEQRRSYSPVVPDLAVEIRSPSNTARELAAKVADYLRTGVRLVWVVDLDTQTVTVHTPGAAPRTLSVNDEITGDAVLPEFRCPVAAFFERV